MKEHREVRAFSVAQMHFTHLCAVFSASLLKSPLDFSSSFIFLCLIISSEGMPAGYCFGSAAWLSQEPF